MVVPISFIVSDVKPIFAVELLLLSAKDALKKIKSLEKDLQNLKTETRQIEEKNNQLKLSLRNTLKKSNLTANKDKIDEIKLY